MNEELVVVAVRVEMDPETSIPVASVAICEERYTSHGRQYNHVVCNLTEGPIAYARAMRMANDLSEREGYPLRVIAPHWRPLHKDTDPKGQGV